MPPHTPRGCRRWRSTPRPVPPSGPTNPCWCRCHVVGTCPHLPVASVGRSRGADTARAPCPCPTAGPGPSAAHGAAHRRGTRCVRCGSDAVRAVVVGARRTAEELGRAFPGTTVITSGGDAVVSEVPAAPALVVATPGAEPTAPGGYGASAAPRRLGAARQAGVKNGRGRSCVGGWALRALVRHRGDGGVVASRGRVGHSDRSGTCDPLGSRRPRRIGARRTDRGGVATRRAHGCRRRTFRAVTALLAAAQLPGDPRSRSRGTPPGARRPPGTERGRGNGMLVRVPRDGGLELAAALRRATGVFSARHDQPPVRVQIDPLHIG